MLLTCSLAAMDFYGPYPTKEHTYTYTEVFNNSFVSTNYALVVLIVPLVILCISVCWKTFIHSSPSALFCGQHPWYYQQTGDYVATLRCQCCWVHLLRCVQLVVAKIYGIPLLRYCHRSCCSSYSLLIICLIHYCYINHICFIKQDFSC